MFKSYAYHMTYTIYKQMYDAMLSQNPQEKIEARQFVAMFAGMQFMFAGASGLGMPIAEDILFGMLDSILGDEDEPWDTALEYRKMLYELLPDDVADIVDRGVVNKVTGWDLSSRISLRELLYRTPDRELDGRGMKQHLLEQLTGPIGGITGEFVSYLFSDGELGKTRRELERLMPKVLRDISRTMRYADEGGVLNWRGDVIVPHDELDVLDYLGKAIGFNPDVLTTQYRTNNAIKKMEKKILNRRAWLINNWIMADKNGWVRQKAQVNKQIAAYNEAQPSYPINPKNIRRSMESKERHSDKAKFGIVVNPRLEHLFEHGESGL